MRSSQAPLTFDLPAALEPGPRGQEVGPPNLSGRHGQVPGPDHCDGRAGGGQGLCPGPAAGVCSQPSSGGRPGTRRTPVCGRLQPLRPQPPGGTADSQRLQAEPRGDPEELRTPIQGER